MDLHAILDAAAEKAAAVMNAALDGFEAPTVSPEELKERFGAVMNAPDDPMYLQLRGLFIQHFGQEAFDKMNARGE